MKHAVIDIGSNTIRLNLYQIFEDGNYRSLFNKKTIAGLASYVEEEQLTRAGIEKLAGILQKFIKLCNTFEVDKIHILATASLRNVNNSKTILRELEERVNCSIDLLSGESEAEYGYFGVREDYYFEDGIIMDIGGGSAEIMYLKGGIIEFETSLPEGSLSLFTKFITSVFPTKNEFADMQDHVRELIQALPRPDLKPPIVVYGIGGTIRACGNISMELLHLPNGKEITAAMVKDLVKKLKNSEPSTLKTVLQVSPERIHTIIPGLILFRELLKHTGGEYIKIGKSGVREGYLLSKLNKNCIAKHRKTS